MQLNTLKFYYKLKKLKIPAYFRNYQILSQEEIHGRDTRFNYQIPRNVTRTSMQQKCLRNHLPIVLNSTSSEILEKIDTHSYNGFSNYAKLKYINEYCNECLIVNCYICGTWLHLLCILLNISLDNRYLFMSVCDRCVSVCALLCECVCVCINMCLFVFIDNALIYKRSINS